VKIEKGSWCHFRYGIQTLVWLFQDKSGRLHKRRRITPVFKEELVQILKPLDLLRFFGAWNNYFFALPNLTTLDKVIKC